ncbi:hypothetical protein NP233_g7016 [Leucocoprinus birnbaumii]|uniref:Transmembrane protein n=1 Tax=Leucocoprinus birnbaumii TaxID=56174 RepID=A0AAD5YT63_9AGAR|nr:hypothetical protein NP233_g7016 [Leucocoprinus birnbaumii]
MVILPLQKSRIFLQVYFIVAGANMVLICSDRNYWAYGNTQAGTSFNSFTFTYLVPVFSIMLHSLWRPLAWRSYMLISIDYLYSMVELVLLIVYTAHFGSMPAVPSVWSRGTLYQISAFTLLITYLPYLLVLAWEILSVFVRSSRRQNFESFSLTWGGWVSLFLGRQPWRQQYLTEGRTARWIRGSVAIGCLGVVVFLAFSSVIVRLVTPSQSTPFRTYWGPVLEMKSLTWLEPTLVLPAAYPAFPLVNQVINASISGQIMLDTDCTHQVYSDLSVINVTVVTCKTTAPSGMVDLFDQFMADFHYTINFSNIPSSPTTSNRAAFYLRDPSADIRRLIDTTDPTVLWPGDKVRGTIRADRACALVGKQAAAEFSIEKYVYFWPVNILSVIVDPMPLSSLDGTQAALRLTIPPITRRAIVREDVPNYTVLDSLSFVGGAWTALNGTFAAFFGSTLLLVLFGIKPLSVYGLVHLLYKKRPVLKFGDEDLTEEEIYRVIRTIREHLLDAENENENSVSKGREMESVSSTDGLVSLSKQSAEQVKDEPTIDPGDQGERSRSRINAPSNLPLTPPIGRLQKTASSRFTVTYADRSEKTELLALHIFQKQDAQTQQEDIFTIR